MIPVIKTKDGFEPITDNPTLTSLDGEQRAPLAVILHESWTDEDRAAFGVYLAEPAVVPEGKRVAGEPSFSMAKGKVVEIRTFEDVPAPPVLSPAEKVSAMLAAYDLDVEAFRSVISGAAERQ